MEIPRQSITLEIRDILLNEDALKEGKKGIKDLIKEPEKLNMEDSAQKCLKKMRQEKARFAIVVDKEEFLKLKSMGKTGEFYGIKVKDEYKLEDLWNDLKSSIDKKTTGGYYYVEHLDRIKWMKFAYAIGGFLFLVFILSSGSIIYMKIYNDASEDKDKYNMLIKIGIAKEDINKAIQREVKLFYIIPLSLAVLHSYFAINILSELLKISIIKTYFLTIAICIVVFSVMYVCSVKAFKKIVAIDG